MVNYLCSGVGDRFGEFFDGYIRPLGDAPLRSFLIKNYILVDVIIATANLVKEWGGDIDKVIPELDSLETILTNIKTVDDLRDQVAKILLSALAYRDTQAQSQHSRLIRIAETYLDEHYMEADLSLHAVSALVNLSPGHFSTVFAQQTGQTFKEYLTGLRLQKARELLRTTDLRSSDISYQVGYNDPHYFSFVFKKNTGCSPTRFRDPDPGGMVVIYRVANFLSGHLRRETWYPKLRL